MKSKLQIFAAMLLILASSPIATFAQQFLAISGTAFDPTTGQPIKQGPQWDESDWKDTNWHDPATVLSDVTYNDVPLSLVAKTLRDQFKDQFDIILPGSSSAYVSVGGQPVPAAWQHDWQNEYVQLHLKNVTVSEIFHAMNLLFEDNRTPIRWELKVNGHRQVALLRVLVDPEPQNPNQSLPQQRRVYFVGNLVGDKQSGGMSMDEIIKTITDVWKMAGDSGGSIQFHQEAQLLVVSGSPSQIDFMDQTLKALQMKVDEQRTQLAHPGRIVVPSQSAPRAGAPGSPDR